MTLESVNQGADFATAAAAFAAVAEDTLTSGMVSQIVSSDLERALTAAVKLYAAKAGTEATPPPPVSADKITPTEIVVIVSELMRAANLNLFDLSMWYRRAGFAGGGAP
jgi:hypothetical protein